MNNDKTPPEHLGADDVAPHGWVLVGHIHDDQDRVFPDPHIWLKDYCYIPAKPKPREWEGTRHELANACAGVWDWPGAVRVRVVEVLE